MPKGKKKVVGITEEQRLRLLELREAYMRCRGGVDHWSGKCHPNSRKMIQLRNALHEAQGALLRFQEEIGVERERLGEVEVVEVEDLQPEGVKAIDFDLGLMNAGRGRESVEMSVPKVEVKIGA